MAKWIRAGAGVVVVVVLGFVVMGWYNDFKSAQSAAPVASPTTTSTVNTTLTADASVAGVGIAQIDGVNFRVKPSSSAKLIRGLKKGEEVTIILKEGQWYQVKDSKGKSGWVTANADYVAIKGK
ncbi:MAG: SH3 domain-containing protein [Coriobacteriia bacterium]|nr:SH3 domain-containing protein [Coriobacteriia bacterium]